LFQHLLLQHQIEVHLTNNKADENIHAVRLANALSLPYYTIL